MPGESESGWTPDLLLAHLQMQIDAMQKMLDERAGNQQEAMKAALTAAKEAVDKANEANEKRFDNVNEFRGQLNDMVSTLLPRAEADARFTSLDEKVGRMASALDKGFSAVEAGKIAGKESSAGVYAFATIGISLLIAVMAVVAVFLHH